LRLNPQVAEGIMQVVFAPSCPACLTGRNYLAIWVDTATNTLRAYSYADGVPTALLATKVWTGDLPGEDISDAGAFLSGTNQVVFRTVSRDHIVTWDIGANTLAVNELHSSVEVRGFAVLGSTVYVFEESGGTVYPMTCDVGASGVNGAGFLNVLGTAGGGPIGASLGDNLLSGFMFVAAGAVYLDGWESDGVDLLTNVLFTWPSASSVAYTVPYSDDNASGSNGFEMPTGELVVEAGNPGFVGQILMRQDANSIVGVFPPSWVAHGMGVDDGLASDGAMSFAEPGSLTMTAVYIQLGIPDSCPVPTIPWAFPSPAPTGNLARFFPLS